MKNMVFRKHTLLLTVLFAARVYMVKVVLSPPEVDVIENSNVTLTCRVMNSSTAVHETLWRENQAGALTGYIFLYPNGTCSATGGLNNDYLFAWSCERNSTFTLTLKDVKRNQHMKEWLCYTPFFQSSNTCRILVRVPVKSVDMKSHTKEKISIQENRATTFECDTTSSRPIPAIFWFLSNPNPLEIINVTNEARQSPQAGESISFAAVTSVLKYSFSRRFNGWSIYCQATNMPAQYVTSRKKLLDIMYPPDGNPKIIGTENGITYSSVEHQLGRLSCIINGGNPPPNLTWLCFEGNVSESSGNESVSSTLTWTVLRKQHNNSCTCVSEHEFGKLNVSTVVKVLYSPDKPIITIHSKSVDNVIEIIENNSLDVTCTSKSNPESDYTWIRSASILEIGQSMRINSVQEKDTGGYTCLVNNTMTGSDRVVHEGRNSANITLHLLYPAEVGNLTETVAIEGSSINMTCPIIPGNPSAFTVKWKPGGDLGSSISHVLYISNISRTDEDMYVCSVTTKMIPTYGPSAVQVNYGQFQLKVVYKARVTNFYIGMETDKYIFTVNETEDVTFVCNIDSKPSPIATIHNAVETVHVSGNNSLVYTRKNIQCTDFGLYICSGKNYFNYGTPSEKNLTLYVNCSPRPSPFVELNEEVRCARNMPVTLSFTALAYPEPGQSGFSWNYVNGSDMTSLSNNSNTAISSSSVQSNLTIKNVSQADYGQYILKIMNRIDVYEQPFVIEPYDVPMPPVILNWTSSETDITITIEASSDGGLTQLFHLKYSEATEENWIRESIKETLFDVFNHTISGLSSGKTYRVIVYATNKLGNSTEETILVETKDYLHLPLDTQKTGVSSNIGAFVGVGVGIVITTLIIVVIVLTVYRRMRGKHTQNVACDVHDVHRQRIDTGIDSESSLTYESLNESKKERDLYSQLPASYEQLDQVTKEKNTYMTIETTSHDKSDYVNIKI